MKRSDTSYVRPGGGARVAALADGFSGCRVSLRTFGSFEADVVELVELEAADEPGPPSAEATGPADHRLGLHHLGFSVLQPHRIAGNEDLVSRLGKDLGRQLHMSVEVVVGALQIERARDALGPGPEEPDQQTSGRDERDDRDVQGRLLFPCLFGVLDSGGTEARNPPGHR